MRAQRGVMPPIERSLLAEIDARPFEAQLNQAQGQWARDNAQRLGGDPQRLFVMGHSAGAYIAAIRGYPKTAWAPDAMLELARALLTQGDRANACSVLANLSSRYPTASAQVKGRAATTALQAKCAA